MIVLSRQDLPGKVLFSLCLFISQLSQAGWDHKVGLSVKIFWLFCLGRWVANYCTAKVYTFVAASWCRDENR